MNTERLATDTIVTNTLNSLISEARMSPAVIKNDLWIQCIPLGGTIAMEWVDGTLVSRAKGMFDSESLIKFNDSRIFYRRMDELLEPSVPAFEAYDLIKTATGISFEKGREVPHWRLRDMFGIPLTVGNHPFEVLATIADAKPVYAGLLAREIRFGPYNGVRLDSSWLYDGGPVFSAVMCGHVLPSIIKSIKLYAQEKNCSMKDAMGKGIFILPVGTDTQTHLNLFLNAISYYTGLTFVTVGANGEFGSLNGDAEYNLNDTKRVIELIAQGKLARGTAYGVSDRVAWSMPLFKMYPAATTLVETITSPSTGEIFGSTFETMFHWNIDDLESNSDFMESPIPKDPDFISVLDSDLDEKDDPFHMQVGYDAVNIVRALQSILAVPVTNLPTELPLGTKILIVNGYGTGNGPVQAAREINHQIIKVWARTGEKSYPLVVISSAGGHPSVGSRYGANLVDALERQTFTEGHVVSARKLNDAAIQMLLGLELFRQFKLETFHIQSPSESIMQQDAKPIQALIDDFCVRRGINFEK